MKKLFAILILGVLLSACSGSKTQKYLGLKGNIESVKETEYDVIEKFGEAEPDDITNVTVYNFDEEGNLIKTAMYDKYGEALFVTENSYKDGEFVQYTTKSHYDELLSTSKVIEKDGDNCKYEIRRGDDITISEFTKSGKYNCVTEKKDGNIIQKRENWFDGNDNLIEAKVTKGEEVIYWTKSKFDKNNNEIECERLKGGDEGIFTFSYSSFDDIGNWTEKKAKKNGEFVSITKREIKYAK